MGELREEQKDIFLQNVSMRYNLVAHLYFTRIFAVKWFIYNVDKTSNTGFLKNVHNPTALRKLMWISNNIKNRKSHQCEMW